jgi:protein ImuB
MFCALAAVLAVPTAAATDALVAVARASSPRVEVAGPGVVVLDARGLTRLFGADAQVAALCRTQAAERGVPAAVAIASTRTAALLLALAGAERIHDPSAASVTVAPGGEAVAVAPLPIALVARLAALSGDTAVPLPLWRRWGLTTLGALAALPAPDVHERLGSPGLAWQAMARGLDARPLVPAIDVPPFAATCAFEWPIEAIEPLSFALGRVIDPLCARLDHDGLGTITLQTTLRLVTRELYVRRLSLPMPMRDPRVLRTLIVLDLESHPPPAGIDALTVTFEPVAGRIVQPSLLARAHPRPETIATLTARLRAVMGEGRVGSPVVLDTHRGGAVGMRPFHGPSSPSPAGLLDLPVVADVEAGPRLTLRRFRQPPAVRVDLDRGRPIRVRALEPRRLPRLGAVRQAAGPWRSSGDWWRVEPLAAPAVPATWTPQVWQPDQAVWSDEPAAAWDDDEWDIVVESGTAVRLARDRRRDTWVVAALID